MRRALSGTCVAAMLALGCESEFQPVVEAELGVDATFIEWTEERVTAGIVPVLDGSVNNLEWGSPDDAARPYSYVQLTAENGFGTPGPSKFIAVKAAYTALWRPDLERYILRNVYLVVQWADLTASQYANSLIYGGPDLTVLEPRIRTFFQGQGLSGGALNEAVDDSLKSIFYTEGGKGFPKPEHWSQDGGDDQLLILIGSGDEEGVDGRTFRNFGVPIARNGSGFGPLGSGVLDAWWWSASRTNPLTEAFNPEDIGGDVDPLEGLAGYADDYHVDEDSPITHDDGPVLWIPNYDASLPPNQRVPLRAWMPRTDQNSGNVSSSRCSQINMGMPFPWLHRFSVQSARMSPIPGDARLFNYRVYLWDTREPDNASLWAPGQFVTGYLLGHDFEDRTDPSVFTFCLPGCPRPSKPGDLQNCQGQPYDSPPHLLDSHHVRAHGDYDPVTRHWIVEFARPVTSPWGDTNSGGNPVHDIDFDGLLDGSRDFYVAFALWDNTGEQGGDYWGSAAVELHFDPPPPRE